MNHVALIGKLATEVELKETSDGKKVADFLLALARPGDGKGADFVRVSVWDRQAETCAEFLTKGRQVGVEGRLKSRSWDEDGRRRSAVEVVAQRVQFLSAGGGPAETPFDAAAAR